MSDKSLLKTTAACFAAGVCVGMTRGRETNRLHAVAADVADARAQFVESMERDPADRGLEHAAQQAVEALRDLITDGPVELVTDELARLGQEAEHVQRQAEYWEKIAARLDAQRDTHRTEVINSTAAIHAAEEAATQARAEVSGPLVQQAEVDGATYLATVENEAAVRGRLAKVSRFGRRKARAEHQDATEQARAARANVRAAWDELPRTPETLPAWAAQVAGRQAESDPRVADAASTVETARAERNETQQRHTQERQVLLIRELGAEEAQRGQYGMRTVNPHRNPREARARAALVRAEAKELRSFPVNDAARRIQTTRTEQEQKGRQTAQRTRSFGPSERDAPRAGAGRDGLTHGM